MPYAPLSHQLAEYKSQYASDARTMAGPSTPFFQGCCPPLLPSSQAWSMPTRICALAPGANDRPSGASCRDRMYTGSWQQLPSVFQSSHGAPLSSTTTLGSIDPPAPKSHWIGPASTGVYGPCGNDEVAAPTHWSPVGAGAV